MLSILNRNFLGASSLRNPRTFESVRAGNAALFTTSLNLAQNEDIEAQRRGQLNPGIKQAEASAYAGQVSRQQYARDKRHQKITFNTADHCRRQDSLLRKGRDERAPEKEYNWFRKGLKEGLAATGFNIVLNIIWIPVRMFLSCLKWLWYLF